MKLEKYRLLLSTIIPVYRHEARFYTNKLWWRDLEEQLSTVDQLCLVAPKGNQFPTGQVQLDSSIRVITSDQILSLEKAKELVKDYDVVQVASGVPWWQMLTTLRLSSAAKKRNKCLILSISSNRYRTTLLNAKKKSLLRRLYALWKALQIKWTQNWLISIADGVFVTGKGLLPLVKERHSNVHIGTASWIRRSEILPTSAVNTKIATINKRCEYSLCIATRFEPMKGVHLGIKAFAILRRRQIEKDIRLVIMGSGNEYAALCQNVEELDLSDFVKFVGTFDYPQPFLSEISKHDILLLTNLNDEQPRIIFDAASQGVIPVCPDFEAYRDFNFPEALFYQRGNAESLAKVIENLLSSGNMANIIQDILQISNNFTINEMHEKRKSWISSTLELKN
jgi:glycosyltransferase involved in cell wall biosynthesis